MSALNSTARAMIKAVKVDAPGASIAGYIRYFFPCGSWRGDTCGCPDDRCIGYHHDEAAECGCLEPCLDIYMRELRQ